MISVANGEAWVGQVEVFATQNRGHSPEELAEMALRKIIYVGEQTHPYIRDQAEVFKENIRDTLVMYLKKAAKSERTTIAARLRAAGHPELIKLLDD
jgi:hypothetical protein